MHSRDLRGQQKICERSTSSVARTRAAHLASLPPTVASIVETDEMDDLGSAFKSNNNNNAETEGDRGY